MSAPAKQVLELRARPAGVLALVGVILAACVGMCWFESDSSGR